jgi:topoisomerase-4 subunit A
VRDESGKARGAAGVRAEVAHDRPDGIHQHAARHTSLESNASINLVMIGADGRPGQKGLLTILDEWVKFRQSTMTRRCRHRLAKVDDRIHILEGRMIVFLNIDEVIRIIRESDEPKAR